jgi:hypothetical protein
MAACAVFATTVFAKPTLEFSGKHGGLVRVKTYTFATPPTPPLAINFSFGAEDAKSLAELMGNNLGTKLRIKIGQKEVMTPMVRDVPRSGELQLTLASSAEYQNIKSILASSP